MSTAQAFLDDGSPMAARILAHDWGATSLGPVSGWSTALLSSVSIMLRTRQPAYIAWGPERISLYNDGHLPVMGPAKHAEGLGQPGGVLWDGVWPEIAPLFDQAFAGHAPWHQDVALQLDGPGHDTRWFSFSYTPLVDDDGSIRGILSIAHETTVRILAERHIQEESRRQQRLFEQTSGFICTTRGPQHVYDYVNAAHRRLFSSQDWLGQTVREALPELEGQGLLELLDQVYVSGQGVKQHKAAVYYTPDTGEAKTVRYLDFLFEPLRDAEGSVTGIFCEGHDVTDRVQALASLSASEDRYRQIVEGTEDFAIISLDDKARISSWNTGAERMMGYTEQEILGQHGELFFVPEDRASGEPEREMEQARRQGRAVNERWHLRRDGSRFWGSGLMMRLDAEGMRFLKIFRDRSAEHEVEAQLRRRSEQLLELAETALEATRADTFEGTLDAIIDAACRIIGAHQGVVSLTLIKDWSQSVSTAALTGKYAPWRDYAASPDGSGIYAWVCEENRPVRMTQAELEAHPRWRSLGANTNEHPPMRGWLAAPLVGRDGRNLGLIQLSDKHDGKEFDASDEAMLVQLAQVASGAAEQSLAETAMRKSEEQLRLATDAAEVGLWDLDTLTGSLFWQNRVKGMFGLPVDTPPSMDDFYAGLHPDDRERVAVAFAAAMDGGTRAVYDVDYRTVGRDGVERWVAARGRGVFDEAGRCVRVLGTAIDITGRIRAEAQLRDLNETLERRVEEQTGERMKVEEALRHAQKMDAVGQLTGGIAHDFNNMLGTVVGSLDLIQRQPADARRVHHLAETGLRAAERGARLTAQLLAFSRAQQIEMKPVGINALVHGMRDMLAHALGPMVRLALDLDQDELQVLADSTQLEMAALNLAINARDAMPEGGAMTVATCLEQIRDDPELGDGPYVVLSVTDTGSGMDTAVAMRAFEPFFTTKGVGEGTGLGLSQVYGIAQQAGGTVRIDSHPGAGTEVRIYLPRSDTTRPAERPEDFPEAPRAPSARTILVVDDDASLRGVVAEALDALGYRVLEAEDGPSGLAAIAAHSPDLVMLDFAMPGMNGAEVARLALDKNPGLPIVFATGYADTAAIAEACGPQALVLRKPFRVKELQAVLEQAFQSRA